ncbi:hypothetical protein DD237_001842 [Peronospora effusa]|uniref:Calcineurin-like phosphoesterase domain-containing protein n=1 Tax=Peronospora effusa TaxID=542832 RepID=A0A425CJQ6_9STRA|nr:hypothetical protein DD237_001842 [Peronospora effusa]
MMRTATAARIALLTDVEGNWQYVRNVVRQSSCLFLTSSGQDETLELRDDCMLVFGGDAGDKGNDTLKCYEQLVSLKKRHPDRVVLLVGNRDVNKMRFTSELHDTEMDLHSMAKEVLEGPMWVPVDKRMTLTQFLAKEKKKKDGDGADDTIEAVNSKTNRLKWILEHTMGAQGDFERRRTELMLRQDVADVTNENVVKSYVESVMEGGALREFLLHGSLAFVAHQTLFVHGGIIDGDNDATLSALGRVPDEPSKHFDSVLEWVDALNAWYRGQVREWIEHPTWREDHSFRGGNELLQYVLPDYTGSVVMGRHLLASGMPIPLPDAIASNCLKMEFDPDQQHDTCARDRSNDTVIFQDVVMCDTSYSDVRAPDNRGGAASEVVVEPSGRVRVNGVLENSHCIKYNLDEDPWIGRWLRDGTMVKARLVNEDASGEEESYLVFRVENGYSYSYFHHTVTKLQEIGLKY